MPKPLLVFVALVLSLCTSHLPAFAGTWTLNSLVPTSELLDDLDRKESERIIVEQINRSDVREHLMRLGVEPAEAQARLAALSQQEVHRIAKQMEQAQYGGILVEILVVVVLVLLIIFIAQRV